MSHQNGPIEVDVTRRIRDLEAALKRQRQLTEYERRRAEALEEGARVAWRWALSGGRRARQEDDA